MRLTWRHVGCHVGLGAEVALRWRSRGHATSAQARRRYGDELAGVRRHGESRDWYQQQESEKAMLVITFEACGRGRKVVGDED